MGLFSKKPKSARKVDPADFLAVRAELLEVRARLESSDQAKAIVEARLAALDATTTAIATGRLGGEDLRARLGDVEGQLLAVSAASSVALTTAESAAHKANAASTLAATIQQTPVEPAPLDAAVLESIEAVAAQVAQLAERVATTDTSTRQAVDLVNTLQQRLTSISTELANQVLELSTDIDGLGAHREDAAKGAVSDTVIASLTTAQVRLAAEQARYEIAFRQDLATLAEQVRRNPKG